MILNRPKRATPAPNGRATGLSALDLHDGADKARRGKRAGQLDPRRMAHGTHLTASTPRRRPLWTIMER